MNNQIRNTASIVLIVFLAIWTSMFVGCPKNKNGKGVESNERIVYVHDTIVTMPEGEFIYNIPCKVVNIHQEKEGKSLLFFLDRYFSKIKK